jgi:hypothetical protein
MPNRTHHWQSVLMMAVAGLLVHAPTLAATADGALLTTYLPAINAAISTFNPDPLALVDTLPNRDQSDTGTSPELPRKCANSSDECSYTPSTAPFDTYDVPTNIPGTCTGTDSKGNPKVWEFQTHDDAGHSIIDSTGTRYLQFMLVTCGVSDAPGETDVGPTAQTWYRTSNDGGVTFTPFKQLVGTGNTSLNPLPGVQIGSNGYQFPGNTLIISSNQEQDVLIPVEIIPPLGADNHPILSPYSVTSNSAVRILRGHWRSDSSDLDWEVGDMASLDLLPPNTQSTRGLDETAVVEMSTKGRCVIVGRGSNEDGGSNIGNPSVQGHYWLFESPDGCKSWPKSGVPLGWDDGSIYFAPAAPPFLFKDRNDRVIFMGAYTPSNSTGNMPRGTVIAAELDLSQLKLLKRTTVIVDEQYATDAAIYDTNLVDLIYDNNYYPQSAGSIFYYTYRDDGNRKAPCPAPHQDQNCYSLNWHLLNPIPNPSPSFSLSADPTVANQVDWPAVPNAQRFIVYARNLTDPAAPTEGSQPNQGFWEMQGTPGTTVPGTATSFLLQSLSSNSDAEVNVFAVDSNGVVTSSNQITIHIQ